MNFPKALGRALTAIDQRLCAPFYDQYPRRLEAEIVGVCETLLDVGCGSGSPVGRFSKRLRHSVGVDVFEPSIQTSQQRGIHHAYQMMDALAIGERFPPKSFDAVVALDLIEHLPKADGQRLLTMMARIARKKVIIFTPNGFVPQGEYDDNRFQRHLSGWDVAELRALGFRVRGIYGWRPLRGEYSLIKWRPTRFWLVLSWLTHFFTENRPEHAFQLLGVRVLTPEESE